MQPQPDVFCFPTSHGSSSLDLCGPSVLEIFDLLEHEMWTQDIHHQLFFVLKKWKLFLR